MVSVGIALTAFGAKRPFREIIWMSSVVSWHPLPLHDFVFSKSVTLCVWSNMDIFFDYLDFLFKKLFLLHYSDIKLLSNRFFEPESLNIHTDMYINVCMCIYVK